MRVCWLFILLLSTSPVMAADMGITVQIPRIDAAEYHRPYVAVWIEDGNQAVAANLAVWYQQKDTKAASGWPICASGGGAAGASRACRLMASAVLPARSASISSGLNRASHRWRPSSRAAINWWSKPCAKSVAASC